MDAWASSQSRHVADCEEDRRDCENDVDPVADDVHRGGRCTSTEVLTTRRWFSRSLLLRGNSERCAKAAVRRECDRWAIFAMIEEECQV